MNGENRESREFGRYALSRPMNSSGRRPWARWVAGPFERFAAGIAFGKELQTRLPWQGIVLLQPTPGAQRASILESNVIVMNETAGRPTRPSWAGRGGGGLPLTAKAPWRSVRPHAD